jgi:hypothetical protein
MMKKQQNFGFAGGKFHALLFAGDPFPKPPRSYACGAAMTHLRLVQVPGARSRLLWWAGLNAHPEG